MDFHTGGLSACASLQTLHLEEATIEADHYADKLIFSDEQALYVPRKLLALSALTDLSFNVGNSLCMKLDRLTSLQRFRMCVTVKQLEFPEGVSRLKNFRDLKIATSAPIKFGFLWTELVALQVLVVHGQSSVFKQLLDIAHVKALKRVVFAHGGPYSEQDIADRQAGP